MTSRNTEKLSVLASITVVLVLSFAAYFTLKKNNDLEDRQRVALLVDEFSDLIVNRFTLYQYGLRGARGTVQAGGYRDISRSTFIDYFKSRELTGEFPGARGIGYIEIVGQNETPAFVDRARRDGFENFSVRELSPNADTRFIIKYIYPLEGNEGATGLDIGSETNRRTAAWKAVQTGHAQLTAPITLVQATGEVKQGFLLLLPVYERPDVSPADREARAIGWTYSPLVVSEVLQDLGPRRDEIAFSISDDGYEGEFYRSPGFENADSHIIKTLTVFGREWDVRFHILPGFHSAYAKYNPLTLFFLVLGIGLTVIFSTYTYLRAKNRSRRLEEESEKLANSIFDAAPQALIAFDPSGVVVKSSPYADTLIARDNHSLEGFRWNTIFSDATIEKLESSLRGSATEERSVPTAGRFVSAVRRSDGSSFKGAISLSKMLFGNETRLVASITDVTAEQKAMEVLSESQQRWQQLANSLPQFVWTCTKAGECDFLSDQWLAYTGRSLDEQIGMQWLEQVHPDDRESRAALWDAAVAAKAPFVAEFRIRGKDGSYRYFYTRAEPILNATGDVVRWIGSNTDIEDRYRAEEKIRELLAEMEARVYERTGELNTALRDLRNIVDAMPTMISYWDRSLKNRFSNKAFEEWVGKSRAEIEGKPLSDLLPRDRIAQYKPYIDAALQGEKSVIEIEISHRTLGKRTAQVHFLPDITDDAVYGYYSLVFDVTALKASEEAQKQARIAAEDTTRAKSAFLTSMSHELRTPMNSILGFSDLLKAQHFGELNAKQLEYVGLIHRSGEHLLSLMDGVLELSKIEAGRIKVSVEPVNLATALRSAIASVGPLAERNQVTITEKNIANADEYVLADTTRLMQVLLNLGSNAIKYNRKGGHVEFSFETRGDGFTRIFVRDNGQGIPKGRQAEAFQPFNRLGAEQGAIEGSGIGLALVKNYVELMGGMIDFESTEGEGTTFWVDLQSASDTVHAAREGTESVDGTGGEKIERPMTVLYVEDNDVNRMLFENYVLVAGDDRIRYFQAREGLEGLEIARRELPDLIFLDINLPGMSGFDILHEIRNDPVLRDIKVTAVSANAMEGDAEKGLKAGFDAYLPKPFRFEQLQEILQEQEQAMARASKRASDD